MNPQKESSRLFSSWLICRGFSLFGGLVWLGCHISLPPFTNSTAFCRRETHQYFTSRPLNCQSDSLDTKGVAFHDVFSFQVRYFTVALFSVGNHDGKIHLTVIWLSVIAYIKSSESVQAAADRTIRSISYSFRFGKYSTLIIF